MSTDVRSVSAPGLAQARMREKTQDARPDGAPRPTAGTKRDADTVHLTETAARLRQIESRLAEMPVVDSARVEHIKLAIDGARYNPDPRQVAEKLVQLEKLLSDTTAR